MKIGLLWYDGSPTPIEDKVRQAALRYRDKFVAWPDTCYVNPGALASRAGGEMLVNVQNGHHAVIVVRVLAAANTLPAHLWIGKSEQMELVSWPGS